MEPLVTLLLSSIVQTMTLFTEARQIIGLAAAVLAAVLAAQVGWHGTDRIIAWRGRADQE
ncbi:hypothetical protein [Actinomadura hibisca]|uniref:hypothetical protein n=1 Tax=Actinomadura hibisca TaxID=68565 RepID=UPI0008308A5D|nr:hypothetical protein [Actinomadura hibisca]